MRAMTSACLLGRSALGLPAGFLADAGFFAGLDFLPALRRASGVSGSGVALLSIVSLVI